MHENMGIKKKLFCLEKYNVIRPFITNLSYFSTLFSKMFSKKGLRYFSFLLFHCYNEFAC